MNRIQMDEVGYVQQNIFLIKAIGELFVDMYGML